MSITITKRKILITGSKELRVNLFYIAIVFIFFYGSKEIVAQTKAEPFERIRVHVSYLNNVNSNYFHDYWQGNDSFQIDIETPFYAGEFFVNSRYTPFSGKTTQVPGIENYQLSLGWGLREEVISNLKIGATFGTLFSTFRYGKLTEEQKNISRSNAGSRSTENEVGFLLSADLNYSINDYMGIRIHASRSIIYTKNKIKLNYIGVGLYRSFETPNWLKQILK